MASISPIIREERLSKGLVPISIRVTVDRRKCNIFLGHRIKTQDWDDEKKSVRKSHPNSVRLNNIIQNYISKIDNYILQKEAQNEMVNFDEIKEKVFNKTITSNTFKEYSLNYLEELFIAKKFSSTVQV